MLASVSGQEELPPPASTKAGQQKLPAPAAESAAPAELQTDAGTRDIAPGTMVVEVLIEGQDAVPLSRIQPHVQTRPNREFDARLVEEDVRRLNRTRLFINVRTLYRQMPGGVAVVYQVVERPTFRYVRFVGNDQLTDRKLSEAIEFKRGDGMDPYSVEEGRRKIEELYQEKGFPKAQVIIFEGTRPGDRGAVYLINEDCKQRVSKVSFVGNTIASDARLRTQIESKAVFLWTFGGSLDREKVDGDKDRLTNYYRSLGFFQARVGRELIDSEGRDWLTGRTVRWVDVRFAIHEGPRSKVRNITVIGNQRYSTPMLFAETKLAANEYFDKGKLDADVATIQEVYGGQGYIYCDVEPETRFLEAPGQVDLVYHIAEGERYRVGRIDVLIKGEYPHTQRRTALNRLSLRPGDIVDTRELRDSERRLRYSGLFNNNPATGPVPKITFSPPGSQSDEELVERPSRRGNVRGQSPDTPWQQGPRIRPTGTIPQPTPRRKIAGPPRIIRGQSPDETSDARDSSTPQGTARPTQRPQAAGNRLRWSAGPPNTVSGGVNQVAYQQGVSSQGPGAGAAAAPRYAAPQVVRGQQPGFGVQVLPGGIPARQPQTTWPQTYPQQQPPWRAGGVSPLLPATQPPATAPLQPRYQVLPTPRQQPTAQSTLYPGQGVNVGPAPTSGPTTGTVLYPGAGVVGAPGVAPQPGGVPGGYELQPGQLAPGGYNNGGDLFPRGGYIDPNNDPAANQPLIIESTETQTGRFQLGVGVNSDAGVLGQIFWDEQNFDWRRIPRSWEEIRAGRAFRGAGQQFRIEAVPGTQVQRYMFTFREPYLFDTPVSFGLSGFYFTRRFLDWDEQRVGGRVFFGYQFTPDLSGNLALRAEDVKISDPSNPAVPELADVLGHNKLYAAQVGLAHDTRDSPFLATEGHYVNLGVQQTFGSFDYPQLTLEGRQYFMLRQRPDGSGRHVLNVRGEVGFTGSETPVYDNFFAGGFATIRGFSFRGASPVTGGVIIGGEFTMLGSVEYMFPITADDMLRGVVFCDTGTVEQDVRLDADSYRVAVGVGARISIPALGPAPIALDFAFPVNSLDSDNTQVFSFYVGVSR